MYSGYTGCHNNTRSKESDNFCRMEPVSNGVMSSNKEEPEVCTYILQKDMPSEPNLFHSLTH